MREKATRGFRERALQAFCEHVRHSAFPCLGAKAALNAGTHALKVYGELGERNATQELARDLRLFASNQQRERDEYATFVATFRAPTSQTEAEFELLLWLQLQMLNEIDDADWDGRVSSDPRDPHFTFSFAGQALYIIGMHANNSRLARRFPWPTLVFNPHEQFERLRTDGKWKRMQQSIRERDVQLQGSVNPMLSDFGERSEAAQYSGRKVDADWQCPFYH